MTCTDRPTSSSLRSQMTRCQRDTRPSTATTPTWLSVTIVYSNYITCMRMFNKALWSDWLRFRVTMIIAWYSDKRISHLYVLYTKRNTRLSHYSCWRHQIETFSALLAICAGNSPVIDEFPALRSVTRSFDFLFHLRMNKRLSKQSWGWWFKTLSRPLWRHCNGTLVADSRHRKTNL